MARPSTVDKHPKKEEILERLRNNSETLDEISEYYGISKTAIWRTKQKLGIYDVKKTAKNEQAKEIQISQKEIDTDRFGRDLLSEIYRIRGALREIQEEQVKENPNVAIAALKEQRAIVETMVKVTETVREFQREEKEGDSFRKLKEVVKKIAVSHPEIDDEIREELEKLE